MADMTRFELAVIPLRQRGGVDHWPTCPHLYFTILLIIKNKKQDACPFGGLEPP